MLKNKIGLFIIFALTLSMCACNNNVIYDHNEIVGEPWLSQNKATFVFEINDTISPYNFYLNIRNTSSYRWSNIFLFVRTEFPNGKYTVDTAEIFLADLQGNWLGSGFGEIKDNQILFRKRGRFPMSGIYKLSFEQAMRSKKQGLIGIESVGIRIERTE